MVGEPLKSCLTVAFRCDASKTMGIGHVMRCLTLAQELRAHGAEIIFICSAETVRSVKLLTDYSYKTVPEDYAPMVDWLVIDHYALSADDYERAARLWAKKILVIDDLANRSHDCDILVDMTHGRNETDYKYLVPSSCVVLTGAQYALLRPEFLALRNTLNRDFHDARRVLVSFGGMNPKGATELALNMLARYVHRELEIDVVIGSNAQGLDEVKALIEQMKADQRHKVTLHIDTKDIANLMARAHLCLGAGGTTSWERCCLALPCIAMELADNQTKVLQGLMEEQALLNMGAVETIDTEYFFSVFSSFLEDEKALSVTSTKAYEICDGKGIRRVVLMLMPTLIQNDGRPVQIRLAELGDMEDVFRWQTLPGVRAFARNPHPPSWEEHKSWFHQSLRNSSRQMFITLYDGYKAGFLRLDRNDGEKYEVSILIAPEFQGKGLGVASLKLLRSYKPFAIFTAEILPYNSASQNIFHKAGYRAYQPGWYVSKPSLQE